MAIGKLPSRSDKKRLQLGTITRGSYRRLWAAEEEVKEWKKEERYGAE